MMAWLLRTRTVFRHVDVAGRVVDGDRPGFDQRARGRVRTVEAKEEGSVGDARGKGRCRERGGTQRRRAQRRRRIRSGNDRSGRIARRTVHHSRQRRPMRPGARSLRQGSSRGRWPGAGSIPRSMPSRGVSRSSLLSPLSPSAEPLPFATLDPVFPVSASLLTNERGKTVNSDLYKVKSTVFVRKGIVARSYENPCKTETVD